MVYSTIKINLCVQNPKEENKVTFNGIQLQQVGFVVLTGSTGYCFLPNLIGKLSLFGGWILLQPPFPHERCKWTFRDRQLLLQRQDLTREIPNKKVLSTPYLSENHLEQVFATYQWHLVFLIESGQPILLVKRFWFPKIIKQLDLLYCAIFESRLSSIRERNQ